MSETTSTIETPTIGWGASVATVLLRVAWALWVPRSCRTVSAILTLNDDLSQKRVPAPLPPGHLTRPSHPIDRYRWDASSVAVADLSDVHEWLRGCEYDHTDRLRREYYQLLPSELETYRRGVCANFAIWAWRKLCDLGREPSYVVGVLEGDDGPVRDEVRTDSHHAWVQFPKEGKTIVYETTRRHAPYLWELETARKTEGYRPLWSVDHRLETYLHTDVTTYGLWGTDT